MIRLTIWSRDGEHVAELSWDRGAIDSWYCAPPVPQPILDDAKVVGVEYPRADLRDDLKRIIDGGLVEWIGDLPTVRQRRTPSSEREFLPRLADYLERRRGFRAQLWELPGDGTVRRGEEVAR
jgi:hypothetical protein